MSLLQTLRIGQLLNKEKNMIIINDTDYIYEEANRIKDGKEPLDRNRLHQYLLDESKSDKRAAKSYLKVLMLHLLKCIYQSEKTSRSWHQSIVNSYNDFYDCAEDSELVLSYIKDNFNVIYNQARTNAYYETGLPLNTFPKDNIFNLTDLLNEDWILEFLEEHPVAKW